MAGDRDDGAPPRPGKGAEVREFRAAGRGKKCPICGAAVAIATRPFCSKRCADLDLGRWLLGGYRIPAEELPDGAEETGEESGPGSGEDPS
ncbi:MAG: DNA gyrase inhibitor YacG [Alphaproteobacteria bacterium]|nr:DNA gyrase inhibitor YacG [Alphaproteobacteria bacterium]